MANTYVLITSSTVGSGGASSIDFTSIPSTYTDLLLYCSLRDSASGTGVQNLFLSYNGTTTGYYDRMLYGNENGAQSATRSNQADSRYQYYPGAILTSNVFSNNILYIPEYAGSNNKSGISDAAVENNASTNWNLSMNGVYLSNTAAITSIKLAPTTGGTFAQYSTAYLYGIKNS